MCKDNNSYKDNGNNKFDTMNRTSAHGRGATRYTMNKALLIRHIYIYIYTIDYY